MIVIGPTMLFMPEPSGAQVDPFQRAMLFAMTPPAIQN